MERHPQAVVSLLPSSASPSRCKVCSYTPLSSLLTLSHLIFWKHLLHMSPLPHLCCPLTSLSLFILPVSSLPSSYTCKYRCLGDEHIGNTSSNVRTCSNGLIPQEAASTSLSLFQGNHYSYFYYPHLPSPLSPLPLSPSLPPSLLPLPFPFPFPFPSPSPSPPFSHLLLSDCSSELYNIESTRFQWTKSTYKCKKFTYKSQFLLFPLLVVTTFFCKYFFLYSWVDLIHWNLLHSVLFVKPLHLSS